MTIKKELAEEFEWQFTYFGENTEKWITFSVPVKKKLKELIKRERKLQEPCHRDYNFLQDLWQIHDQFLLIISLKDRKCETYGINYKGCLECTSVKYDLTECKCLCYKKNYKKIW